MMKQFTTETFDLKNSNNKIEDVLILKTSAYLATPVNYKRIF